MLRVYRLRADLAVVLAATAVTLTAGCDGAGRLEREKQAAADSAAAVAAREKARSDSILRVAADWLTSELPRLGRHAARQTLFPVNVSINYSVRIDSAKFEGCDFTVYETSFVNEASGRHLTAGSLTSIDVNETRVRRQPWDNIRLSNVLWDVQVSMVRGDSASILNSDGVRGRVAWKSLPVRDSVSGQRIVAAITDAASACGAPRSAY